MGKNSILIIFLLLGETVRAGTGANNGGDVLFSYLKEMRFVLVKIASYLELHRNQIEDSGVCGGDGDREERGYCLNFVRETYADYIVRARDDTIEFKIRSEDLFVELPDGSEIQVAARTPLGGTGMVEFHYGTVKNYTPQEMLFLVIHEFSHKVLFRGDYVNDHDERGPFSTGRDLIDFVSWSMVDVAKEQGFIGFSFTLLDKLVCHARYSESLLAYNQLISPRSFFGSNDFDNYEISLGNRPTEPTFYVPFEDDELLEFRLRIAESSGCRRAGTGRTDLQINRLTPGEDPLPIASKTLYTNPLCFDRVIPLKLTFENYEFQCIYDGSFSTSR